MKDSYEYLRHSPYESIFVSPTAYDIFLQLDFEDQPESSKFGTLDPSEIVRTHESFEQEVGAQIPGVRAEWLGEGDYQAYMLKGMQQMGLLNLCLIAFLILTLRAVFGSWRAGTLFVFTLLIAGGVLYGLMGWFGAPLDVLTNSLFLMLAVSALEDFVFIANDLMNAPASEDWANSFRKLVIPGFLTSLTTIFGFISLCGVRADVIPRFGFWAAIGALLEFLVMFSVLPALIWIFPALSRFAARERAWIAPSLYRFYLKPLPQWLIKPVLLIIPLAVISSFHLKIYDAPLLLFPEGHPIREATGYAEITRGWEAPLDVVFKDFDDAAFNRKVISDLKKMPEVIAVQDPYEILDFMTSKHPPLTSELIRREFTASESFRQMVTETGEVRLAVFVARTDMETVNTIRKRLELLCPNEQCHATGSIVAYGEFTEEIPRTLLQSFLTSLALVAGIILGLAWVKGARRPVPLLVSMLWDRPRCLSRWQR